MANTYSQIFIHAVFTVKSRENIIIKIWRDDLHRYISGIITKEQCKSLAVGGWEDHIHVFFGMPVTKNVSDIMRVVKTNSSKWINEKEYIKGKFEWQSGYGAFSYSKSQRDTVIKYIMGQEEHHKHKSFKEEYIDMLDKFAIEYDEKYLFEFYD